MITQVLNRTVSWMANRPVFLKVILLAASAALLAAGLAAGETDEILFKGSIL
jgi:hypothetical protein